VVKLSGLAPQAIPYLRSNWVFRFSLNH